MKGRLSNMSRMCVSRSYRQLMAERNALRLMIHDKEKRIELGERIATEDYEFRELSETKRQLESDKALLQEVENDIQIFRERNLNH